MYAGTSCDGMTIGGVAKSVIMLLGKTKAVQHEIGSRNNQVTWFEQSTILGPSG